MFFKKNSSNGKKGIKRPKGAPKPVGITDVKDQETLGQYLKNLMWVEKSRNNN